MCALAAAWIVAAAMAAEPTPPRFELAWAAPASCPSHADVVRSIDETVGPVAPAHATATLRARAEIVGEVGAYVLRLGVGESAEVRELAGASCEELAATAAFIVAIAVDPRALSKGAPAAISPAPTQPVPLIPTPAPAPAPAAASVPAVVAAPRREPRELAPTNTPARPRPWPSLGWGGRVIAGVGAGPSPAVTATMGASVGMFTRNLRFEVEGQYWAMRRVASARNDAVFLAAQMWNVGLRGCAVLGTDAATRWLEFPVCALAQAGAIHARGEGELTSRRTHVPWVGVGGGAMILGWLRPRFGLGCGIDVLGVVVRGGFRSEPSGDIDRVGSVAVTGLCGIAWRSAPPQATDAVLDRSRPGQSER